MTDKRPNPLDAQYIEDLLSDFRDKCIEIMSNYYNKSEHQTGSELDQAEKHISVDCPCTRERGYRINTLHLEFLANHDETALFQSSIYHYIDAKQFFNTGDTAEAIKHVSQAYFQLGKAQGFIDKEAVNKHLEKSGQSRKEAASKGGIAKAQEYSGLISLVEQLYQTLKPKDGWKNKSAAAHAIANALAEEKKYPPYKYEDFDEYLEKAQKWVYKKLTDKGSPLYKSSPKTPRQKHGRF